MTAPTRAQAAFWGKGLAKSSLVLANVAACRGKQVHTVCISFFAKQNVLFWGGRSPHREYDSTHTRAVSILEDGGLLRAVLLRQMVPLAGAQSVIV